MGLGWLYNVEAIKGLLFLFLFPGTLLGLPLYTPIAPLLIVPVIGAVAVLDAYMSAGKIDQLQKAFRKRAYGSGRREPSIRPPNPLNYD